jgi:hypothetical protein
MPNPKPQPSRYKAELVVDNLSQTEVSRLTGLPTVYFRDNSHLPGRKSNGRYNLPELLRGLRTQYEPAQLSPEDTERLRLIAEEIGGYGYRYAPAAVRLFKSIENRFGAAGMAAVAELFVEAFELEAASQASDSNTFPSPEEIRLKHMRAAESEIAALPQIEAEQNLMVLKVCDGCNRYRWGDRWVEGMKDLIVLCPRCE